MAQDMEPGMERIDLTEREDGPALIALTGGQDAASAFQLGSRETGWHSHKRGQLVCIETGLLHIRTAQGSWLLPPHRAGWIPPGTRHWGSMSGALSGWSVLLAPAVCDALPSRPQVIGVGPLMRALVARAATWTDSDRLDPQQERLTQVLLDEIAGATGEPLHLPMPTDRRLLRIATALLDRPQDDRTLEAWAAWAAVSPRTARRLFLAETGMTFAHWRQQARLVHALEMLARGDPVAVVADALGYATPSNFIAMFRRAFGDSPGHYFAGEETSRGGRPAAGAGG